MVAQQLAESVLETEAHLEEHRLGVAAHGVGAERQSLGDGGEVFVFGEPSADLPLTRWQARLVDERVSDDQYPDDVWGAQTEVMAMTGKLRSTVPA